MDNGIKNLMNNPNLTEVLKSLDGETISSLMGNNKKVKNALNNMNGEELLQKFKAKTQAPVKRTRVVKKRRQRQNNKDTE